MTEENAKETKSENSHPNPDAQPGNTVRKRLTLTIFIVILMAVTAIAAVYRQEIYVGVVRTVTNLLNTKADPGKKTEVSANIQSEKATSMDAGSGLRTETGDVESIQLQAPASPVLSLAAEVARSVQDVTKPEAPPMTDILSATKSEPTATASQDSKPLTEVPKIAESPNPTAAPKKLPESPKTPSATKPEKNVESSKTIQPEQKNAKNEISDTKTQPSSEQFQVPGSLTVRIENYSGSLTKWRLMVILDDSQIMAKDTKPWDPNRLASATSFISKLSTQITPGSKLAVRDFACVSKDEKAKRSPCLSRMLFDWSDAPFNGLRDRLSESRPGGEVNPCAAAAYSMKKDFLVSDALNPRLLLITAGAAKCDAKEVLKAAGAIGPSAKTHVDILAVGMSSKKKAAYTNLAKKTGGVFLQVDNPADQENMLRKYSKSLHVTSMDKIEIRGDKVVFSVNFDEDITLAPGTYTVVLPSVKGLAEFKRSVPNVKIKSGEATLMTVRLSKGKATVKIGPK